MTSTLTAKELQVGQSFSLSLPFARDRTLVSSIFNEDGTMTLRVKDWMGRPGNSLIVSPELKVFVSSSDE